MGRTCNGRCGVQYADDQSATDLLLADDSAIFAENDAEATHILHDITQFAQPHGLNTKVLTTAGSPATVHLKGVQIEQVREFKYLGSLVQEKKVASRAEIDSRIG